MRGSVPSDGQQPRDEGGGHLVAVGDVDGLGHQDLGRRVEEVERGAPVGVLEPRLGDHQGVGDLGDAPLAVLRGQAELQGDAVPRALPGPAVVVLVDRGHRHLDGEVPADRVADLAVGDDGVVGPPVALRLLAEELPRDAGRDRAGLHGLEEVGDDLGGRLAGLRRLGVEVERGPGRGHRRGLHLGDRAVGGHPHARRQAEHDGEHADEGGGPSHADSRASVGTRGSGLWRSGCESRRGSVRRNWAPSPGRPQAWSQPPWRWVSSREMDRPEAGAAAGAGPGRVGAPEAVEDHRRLPRPEADAVVAHRDRGRVVVAGHQQADVAALGVVDGVGDEVAHDPLDPARVRLG